MALSKNIGELEKKYVKEILSISPPKDVRHIYNPLDYAGEVHAKYLEKYLKSTKKMLIISMNPGFLGMTQTGVPFGNISTIKKMDFKGQIRNPANILPTKPITGLLTEIDEPSGKLFWSYVEQKSNGNLDLFFKQCFVLNCCPLSFLKGTGGNVVVEKLAPTYRDQVVEKCLKLVEDVVSELKPDVIVGMGRYVFNCLNESEKLKTKRIIYMRHPNRQGKKKEKWIKTVDRIVEKENLQKYFINKG